MKYFITFGSESYVGAGSRLLRQANESRLFDSITLYNENFLKNDIDFWERHKVFIENNKRGYGYWIWKPYIIKKTMEQMKDGDFLLYLDNGSEIGKFNLEQSNSMFFIAKRDLILATTTHHEKDWCKRDLLIELDMIHDKYLHNSPQRQAGEILIYVCNETRDLVNKWYDLSCNYHLLDDSPSYLDKEFDCFKEHRHDQSIFSLLTKKYEIFSLHHSLDHFPIFYNRNRTECSSI